MRQTSRGIAATLITLGLAVTTVGPAAAGDDDVIRRGSCTGSTDWKMKAGPDDGRIEVEAEIDSNKAGQKWRWVLRRNGTKVARGTSMTKGPSGSFEVHRRTKNGAGKDSFRFRAVNPRSGERCVARVQL